MEDERLGDREARIEEFTDVASQQPHATILRQKPGVPRRQIVDDDDLVRAALEEPRAETLSRRRLRTTAAPVTGTTAIAGAFSARNTS
jgi:hypothetical protein